MGFKGCEPMVAAYLGFTGGPANSLYLGYAISLFDEVSRSPATGQSDALRSV